MTITGDNRAIRTKKSYLDKREGRNTIDSKTCTQCGRLFGEGHLKKCPAMGKKCKN